MKANLDPTPLVEPPVDKLQYQQILDVINQQLYRFEVDAFGARIEAETQITYYWTKLQEVCAIAFSCDPIYQSNPELKIDQIRTIFSQIANVVLYDQTRYPWYCGVEGSEGYYLAQYICLLMKRAENLLIQSDTQASILGATPVLGVANYEDVVNLWKLIEQKLVSRQKLINKFYQTITHFEIKRHYNYISWILQQVNQMLRVCQSNANSLEKYVFTGFTLDLLTKVLWATQRDLNELRSLILPENFKQLIVEERTLADELLTIHFVALQKLMLAKVFASDLTTGTFSAPILMTSPMRFTINRPLNTIIFSKTTVSVLRDPTGKEINYYQPIDLVSGLATQTWKTWQDKGDIRAMLHFLKQHNLIIQT